MSGARFARSGRVRFFICFVALLLMLGMVAIFHNTTRQLDQTREKHLACEQQQETLNEQLQSIVEEKYTLQKNYKVELDEQMQTRQDLEQKLKNLNEQVVKEKLDTRMQYDKLQQAYKLLQSEHKEFVKECTQSKQQLLDNANELNQKMKILHSKELIEQSVLSSELAMWQEKYNKIVNEKERLESLLNVEATKNRLVQLEHIVAEYQTHCQFQPKAALAQLLNNKPLEIPKIASKSSPQTPKLSESSKSFNQQIAPQINKKLSDERNNKMELRLGASHKPTFTEASEVKQKHENATNKFSRAVEVIGSSTKNMPPLQFPPQVQQQQHSRKLPDNVAPIPEHFEDFLKNEEKQQQPIKEVNNHDNHNNNVVETQGDAAVAETQNRKSKNMPFADGDNNNRYANVVKDMDGIASKDIKENESFMNEQSFNIPNNEDEHNFFDAADDKKKNLDVGGEAINNADAHNAADDFLGNGNEAAEEEAADAGDIEVKQNKNVMNVDNVNNEVAGDHGKEFDDGLHLEEGIEEDADEDDYPHLARQKGEEAIRN